MTDKPKLDPYLAQFGSGLCYSLALFIAHEGNFRYILAEMEMLAADGTLQFTAKEKRNPQKMRRVIEHLAAIRWFSHAVNPIRNLVIPESLPKSLRQRLQRLRTRCTTFAFPTARPSPPRPGDVIWLINEARELIRALDEYQGISTIAAAPVCSATLGRLRYTK